MTDLTRAGAGRRHDPSEPADGWWIDLRGGGDGPGDDAGDTDARLDDLASRFGLHELAVEDARHAHQRPKLERYGDTLVVVAKPAVYDDDEETVRIGELLAMVGPSFVVSVRHGIATDLLGGIGPDPAEHRLGDRRPVDVLYELLDAVVDGYQPIVQGLQIDIAEIEHDVFSVRRSNPAPRIYALKRQVLDVLRNVEPLAGPVEALADGTALPDGDLDQYFRDVADHVHRLVAELHTINDVLSDALQANLAQVSVAQNDDMRRISAWAAIFLLPTLLAGVWGMNFRNMPELDWRLGYPLALAVMAGASVALWWRFRRTGWLGGHDRGRRVRR